MKNFHRKTLLNLTLFLILPLLFFSCEKSEDNGPKKNDKSEDNDTIKIDLNSTGWFGSDNTSTIPENVSNPFQGDPSTLPTSVDLSQYFPPIGDQGQYGTCVAWATAYNAKSAIEAIKFGLTPSQFGNEDNTGIAATDIDSLIEGNRYNTKPQSSSIHGGEPNENTFDGDDNENFSIRTSPLV